MGNLNSSWRRHGVRHGSFNFSSCLQTFSLQYYCAFFLFLPTVDVCSHWRINKSKRLRLQIWSQIQISLARSCMTIQIIVHPDFVDSHCITLYHFHLTVFKKLTHSTLFECYKEIFLLLIYVISPFFISGKIQGKKPKIKLFFWGKYQYGIATTWSKSPI